MEYVQKKNVFFINEHKLAMSDKNNLKMTTK